MSGPRTVVVVAHDAARIDSLVSRGVLRAGLDLLGPDAERRRSAT